jgi:histone deacetylase 11
VKVFYHERFNIDLGILNRLHRFDGLKFRRVRQGLANGEGLDFVALQPPISQDDIDRFVSGLMRRLLSNKRYILEALEVPYLPFVPFSVIDRRVLEPMRWAASATLQAARAALAGNDGWNLAGGYHHASKTGAEGFCIYNDVGMAVEHLRAAGALAESDEILIVDIDAHHGNGNARVFLDDRRVFILDIYNDDIYPNSPYTKERLDIAIPLRRNSSGPTYLSKLEAGLRRVEARYRMAFVVAGTDVLSTDPLGGLGLSVDECVERDQLVWRRLRNLGVPAVFLGGGGYGKDSATAMIRSIRRGVGA